MRFLRVYRDLALLYSVCTYEYALLLTHVHSCIPEKK